MKRSIRLDPNLIQKAEEDGAKNKRSIALQIEYWAELGMAAESGRVSRERLRDLNRTSAQAIAEIQRTNDSGEFQRQLLSTGFAYERSKMGPGFTDKVLADGTRVTGRVVKGEFVELAKTKAK